MVMSKVISGEKRDEPKGRGRVRNVPVGCTPKQAVGRIHGLPATARVECNSEQGLDVHRPTARKSRG